MDKQAWKHLASAYHIGGIYHAVLVGAEARVARGEAQHISHFLYQPRVGLHAVLHRVVLVEQTASHNARLGILLEISQHSFDGFGIDHGIVVENEDVSALRSCDALIASGSHAAIFGIGYDLNLGKRLLEHL